MAVVIFTAIIINQVKNLQKIIPVFEHIISEDFICLSFFEWY